ncbi:glycosyltransferase [Clostridium estertheticum]|nr:glycosyltransferase [Clostridium estertheticum]MBZ9616513.1 glycosyltransferase [Clostridium estertheticum subsp. laramiense]WAG72240.1 glycosyltransferase [Clostridium estertheticum]
MNTNNLGTVKNLNIAISLATGDYLLFDGEVISNIVKCF